MTDISKMTKAELAEMVKKSEARRLARNESSRRSRAKSRSEADHIVRVNRVLAIRRSEQVVKPAIWTE